MNKSPEKYLLVYMSCVHTCKADLPLDDWLRYIPGCNLWQVPIGYKGDLVINPIQFQQWVITCIDHGALHSCLDA